MIVTVVGLGLIGGSLCKAIKKNTSYTCYGYDINQDVCNKAVNDGVIDGICNDFSVSDLTIIALYPNETIKCIVNKASKFKKGSLVIDCCGVKSYIVNIAEKILLENGVDFLGTHPMAGKEFSGFENSVDNLFENAYFIITPTSKTPKKCIDFITEFAKKLKFRQTVVSTTEMHDEIIAFTSQLAHIVSSAYMKSPSSSKEMGFSAGSFRDMTRVARLNENMWTSLFLINSKPLIIEIDEIIKHLSDYREAISENNSEKLKELLKQGRLLKEQNDIKDNE